MGAFGVIVGILHYAGLYVQLNTALKEGYLEVDNHISGNDESCAVETEEPGRNTQDRQRRHLSGGIHEVVTREALFTEVPHDITTHSGEDVEMACSFRGAGPPSYSLEIQWWYIKDHRDWQEKTDHTTNNVVTLEEMSTDATKISVVKVAGSNISHKLRLSSVKPSDQGTYECRVIDHSGPVAQRHRVRAYLQVGPEESLDSDDVQPQEPGYRSQRNPPHTSQLTEGRERRKEPAGSPADCNDSCVF